MKVFKIQEAAHKGKEIKVTQYTKHANGVTIQVQHNVPSAAGKQLRWVQTVSENGSFFKDCGKRHYVDPFGKVGAVVPPGVGPGSVCKADDAKPFYWTDGEFGGTQGPFFYDKPSENAPAKGRTWINFVLGLTEVTGTSVHHLVAITWGFDILSDGTVKPNGLLRATMAQMRDHGRALKSMYPAYKYT